MLLISNFRSFCQNDLDPEERQKTADEVKKRFLVDSQQFSDVISFVPVSTQCLPHISQRDLIDLKNFTDKEKDRLISRTNQIATSEGGVLKSTMNTFFVMHYESTSTDKRPHFVEEQTTGFKCSCIYFENNRICKYSLAVACKENKMKKLLTSANRKGRNLTKLSNHSVSKTTGRKRSDGIKGSKLKVNNKGKVTGACRKSSNKGANQLPDKQSEAAHPLQPVQHRQAQPVDSEEHNKHD